MNKNIKKKNNRPNIWAYIIAIMFMMTLCLAFNVLEDKQEELSNERNNRKYNN